MSDDEARQEITALAFEAQVHRAEAGAYQEAAERAEDLARAMKRKAIEHEARAENAEQRKRAAAHVLTRGKCTCEGKRLICTAAWPEAP